MRRTTTTTGALALLKTCCSNPSVSLALHEFHQLLSKFCKGERNIKILPRGLHLLQRRSGLSVAPWFVWRSNKNGWSEAQSLNAHISECFFYQHWTSSIWWSKSKLHKKEAPPQLTEARCRRCARGLCARQTSRRLRCQGWGSAPWK